MSADLHPTIGARFSFPCDCCGSVLEATLSQAGQRGRCPTCSSVFSIPEVDSRTGLPRGIDRRTVTTDPMPVHAYAAAGDKAPNLVQSQTGDYTIACPRCMRQSEIESIACSHCGMPFTIEGARHAGELRADGHAVAAMVLGLFGLFLGMCQPHSGALLSAASLALAFSALNRLDARPGGGGRGLAYTSAVVGGLGLLGGTIQIVGLV